MSAQGQTEKPRYEQMFSAVAAPNSRHCQLRSRHSFQNIEKCSAIRGMTVVEFPAAPECAGKQWSVLDEDQLATLAAAVLADGFAWNGKTYPSLSKVAFEIAGTRWNGPKFFGLREKPSKGHAP